MPEYERIAGDIRRQIRDSALAPEDRLPSAAALSDHYGVSMITAKNAMNVLRSEGLIYGVPGKGTFVTAQRRLRRSAPHRYFQGSAPTYVLEAERARMQPRVEHATSRMAATDSVARRLDLSVGDDVAETTTRTFADDRPVSWSYSWEPLAITANTEIEDPHAGAHGGKGLAARFAAIGWTVEQVEENLIIRDATTEERTALALPLGAPVAEVRQTVRAVRDGQDDLVPIEAADIVFATDRIEFNYLMDRPH
ncbi:GntR family transcriptional regulator [Pseudonocardia sp. MH-G8]|uniref:GntR family transcriptional regulator n=1 Tax=Pseudonocardia sp. MH-G8 TaxID=1854588 RepID=UPI0013042814|nr:GntR family transcriptional regulator [Pseudonocardia sp. MH-G8]